MLPRRLRCWLSPKTRRILAEIMTEEDGPEEGRLERALRKGLRGKALPEDVVEAAARLREDWGLVTHPEGRSPYFERKGGRPEFDPDHSGFREENAWLLSEFTRLVYLPAEGEKGREEAERETRRVWLEKVGVREVASVVRRNNHAALFECDEGGGFSVLVFRGTMSTKQWLLNLSTIPVPWDEGCYVHQGFKFLFDEIWSKILPALEKVEGPLFFAGHSLGGALATLAATRFAPRALYTFGSPRVGNTGFRDSMGDFPNYRIVNGYDVVTLLPYSVDTFAPYDFHHAGELHYLAKSGELLIDPQKEEIPVESERVAAQPLSFLMDSFKGAQPPVGLVDHAPSRYAAALERVIH